MFYGIAVDYEMMPPDLVDFDEGLYWVIDNSNSVFPLSHACVKMSDSSLHYTR